MMQNYMSSSLFDIKGKKALGAGGTKGLGREMALCLLENGCDVMAVSRKIEGNEDMTTYAKEHGVNVWLYSCDVLNADEVAKM